MYLDGGQMGTSSVSQHLLHETLTMTRTWNLGIKDSDLRQVPRWLRWQEVEEMEQHTLISMLLFGYTFELRQ